MEKMFLPSLLEAAEIPYLLVGGNFGSIYPGVQIPIFNETKITVPLENYEQAVEIVREFRDDYEGPAENLDWRSKTRIITELILFGWFAPAGTKKQTYNKAMQRTAESGR